MEKISNQIQSEKFTHETKPEFFSSFLLVNPEYLEEECEKNGILKELFGEMKKYCLRYTADVIRMESKIIEDGFGSVTKEEEDSRTRLHNATMDSIRILARTMKQEGIDTPWISDLTDRSKFAKFALAFGMCLGAQSRDFQDL